MLACALHENGAVAAGVVAAFPGTPLGTIRESSSSWGSPRSTEHPVSLPTCQGEEQAAVVGSGAGETDKPLWQAGPLNGEHKAKSAFHLHAERQTSQEVGGQRAELAFQADGERQAGHRVAGQEAEAAGSLQSPFDSVSEVAESLALEHYGSSSAVSVNSEVISEADAATQAVWSADASGKLLFSLTVSCCLHVDNAGCRADSY